MKEKIHTPKGEYKYNFVPIYLGIKQINKPIAKENLLLLKSVFDKSNIKFLLGFGTLLGAMREHDFITHDEDIDLLLLKKDMNSVLSLLFKLRELGFEVVRFERRGFMSVSRKNEYIDFYFYQDYQPDNSFLYCGRDLYFKVDLESPSTIDFLGSTFYAPQNPVQYLRFNYGDNWMTPVKWNNYQMPAYKRYINKVIQYVKFLIPDSMTEKLQYQRDKKILDKWYQKAKLIERTDTK